MPEEASSTFHPPKQEMRPPSSVCCRRVVNVLEGFASVFYISNKSRLLAFAVTTMRGLLPIKRRRCNAVIRQLFFFAHPFIVLRLSESLQSYLLSFFCEDFTPSYIVPI